MSTGYTYGSLGGTNAGRYDVWLARYDSNGNQVWIRQFGTSNDEFSNGVAVDSAGNIYITGYTNSSLGGTSKGYDDVWLARYDSSGNQAWIRQFGSSTYDQSNSVAVDSAGNIYITGYTEGSLEGTNAAYDYDAWLARYDSSGNQVWIRQLGTSVGDYSYSVAVDSAGHVYITGYTDGSLGGPNAGSKDAWLAQYDSSGNHVWTRQFGTSVADYSNGVAVDSAGNVYITGYTEGSLGGATAGYDDAWLARYDSSGNQVWARQLGTSYDDQSNAVAVDSAGNVYITGNTYGSLGGTNVGYIDTWLAQYSNNGILMRTLQPGTSGDDGPAAIVVDYASNVYVSGDYLRTYTGNSNARLFKYIP